MSAAADSAGEMVVAADGVGVVGLALLIVEVPAIDGGDAALGAHCHVIDIDADSWRDRERLEKKGRPPKRRR